LIETIKRIQFANWKKRGRIASGQHAGRIPTCVRTSKFQEHTDQRELKKNRYLFNVFLAVQILLSDVYIVSDLSITAI